MLGLSYKVNTYLTFKEGILMLLNDAIIEFKRYLTVINRSIETISSYASDLSGFESFIEKKYNGPVYIDEIEAADIEDYLYSLKIKNLQSSTRSRNLYTLRSFWNFAYKNKLCKWNTAIAIEPIKTQKKERTYLSIDEVNNLINAVDHPLIKVVIQTLFYTGMRISECLKLKINDVDMEEKIIHVINGKGGKDRDIPINEHLLQILKNYLENRSDIISDYFFATKKTGKLCSAYVNHVIEETVKKLGWKKHVSAHILRHSFASNLIKNGVSLVYVQKLLGHSNLNVTSIYTHANIDDLKESINLL